MSTLLVWKDQIEKFYAKYSFYILKVLQFVLGLCVFGMINSNIGFMKSLSSTVCTVGLAAVTAFSSAWPAGIVAAVFTDPVVCTVTSGGGIMSGNFSGDVYLVYPLHTKKILADRCGCTGRSMESTVSDPGCIWTAGHADPGASSNVWGDRLLYASYSEADSVCVSERRHERDAGLDYGVYKADTV